ncbi:hypothetical protein [Caballeronia terrestris]|jgi:hypothetical protein|uniref:hypothetical protein n=1 Tax=Caballeronia terrestris TaxID=1226301 RepID=UPI000F737202|nr:hypothetical protein [Caballeronia terrestris]
MTTLTISTRRRYEVLIAHPSFAGAMIPSWDPADDVQVSLAPTENMGSVILFSAGYIPGLHGRLNPILDTENRTCLYADNIAVDGGKNQSATFIVNHPIQLEDCNGIIMQIRILYIKGRTSLIQFVHSRYDDQGLD